MRKTKNNLSEIDQAKKALDSIISKARSGFYKPIQIAEILYRDRIHKDINLSDKETYRIRSKVWRDKISKELIGNNSTSSARFQDNLFEENA
jgi:type II restriction enzyme